MGFEVGRLELLDAPPKTKENTVRLECGTVENPKVYDLTQDTYVEGGLILDGTVVIKTNGWRVFVE